MKFRRYVLALVCISAAFCVEAQTNTPPTISGTPSTSAKAGSPYSFTPTGRDANGDYLRFYVANKPAWAAFSMTTGVLSGTPTAAQVGSYKNISIYVSDSKVSTFLPTFNLNVTSGGSSTPPPTPTPTPTGNQPPTISGSPRTSVAAGTAYSFQPSASDANGDYLRFYIATKPAWATFSMTTGVLSGTPTAAQVGSYSNISIYVSDSKVSTFLPTFNLNVTSSGTVTNRAPVISGSPPSTIKADSAYSFQPSASDADGDALSFSVAGKPSWATFSVSKGFLTGTPTTAQIGSYPNIVITASDGKASTSLASFGITVSAVAASGEATLSWTAPTQNTNGTQLTNLAGFRVYHGTSAGSLTYVTQVGVNTTSYVSSSLASGTHYFAVSAYNSTGAESSMSVVGSKNIP
jgi:hypothetical protein